ncbi:SNF2 family N-terminal domain-containing protein [Gongronella butleri]|nr:SNF2 family N-terminal domain-containing protein [Gongronella butleri]
MNHSDRYSSTTATETDRAGSHPKRQRTLHSYASTVGSNTQRHIPSLKKTLDERHVAGAPAPTPLNPRPHYDFRHAPGEMDASSRVHVAHGVTAGPPAADLAFRPPHIQQPQPQGSEDDPMVIDDEGDATPPANVCLGMLKSEVVARQPLYFAKDDYFEPVSMHFEGKRHDNYSFTLTSRPPSVKLLGWAPFHDTRILGPLAERGLIWWDAMIPKSKASHVRVPLYIIVYCTASMYAAISDFLVKQRVGLLDPPFFNPACRYRNPTAGSNGSSRGSSTPSTPNNGSSSSSSINGGALGMDGTDALAEQQMKRELAQLLDSLPSKGNLGVENDDSDIQDVKALQLPGMTVSLMPYQLEGIHWMIDREANDASNGGILADDMGLGKTIQTIGLVVSTHKPAHTTLIVAPLALLHQWDAEVADKTTKNKLKVLIHHGPGRAKTASTFARYDIVISTYQMVSADMASSSNDSQQDGPLLQMHWHRVVLDEAQQIKNHATRTAQACTKLIAKKRWCLTGTPIQNRVEELYSLLRFLRIQPLCEMKAFRQTVSAPIQQGQMPLALRRLKAVLMVIMLRRTKHILHQQTGSSSTSSSTSSSNASSGTSTPQKSGDATTIVSGATTTSNASSPVATNATASAADSPASSSSNVVIFGLPPRERQDIVLTFSPHERALYDFLQAKTRHWLRSIVDTGKESRNYLNVLWMVLRLRQACNHPKLVTKAISKDDDIMALASDGSVTPSLLAGRKMNDASMDQLLAAHMSKQLGWDAISPSPSSTSSSPSPAPPSDKTCELCGRARDTMGILALYCSTCTQRIAMYTQHATRMPSSKINKMIEILSDTRKHAPDQKTIIYSQFTSMLDLLEQPLADNGFKFCRYDGAMSTLNREKSLAMLKTDPECTVMLTSLKCGSLGLNLTAANRVILLDVWWNPAVEDQAIDRVHRIGQKLPVHVTRLLIDNTIEQKIIKLQERKALIAKGALGDHATTTSKLTIKELLSLFDV